MFTNGNELRSYFNNFCREDEKHEEHHSHSKSEKQNKNSKTKIKKKKKIEDIQNQKLTECISNCGRAKRGRHSIWF